jgi:hypothetical protein
MDPEEFGRRVAWTNSRYCLEETEESCEVLHVKYQAFESTSETRT